MEIRCGTGRKRIGAVGVCMQKVLKKQFDLQISNFDSVDAVRNKTKHTVVETVQRELVRDKLADVSGRYGS